MHVYVDESERPGAYIMCAIYVQPAQLNDARKTMKKLRKPGQRRIHMVKERGPRRKELLTALPKLGVQARIYQTRGNAVAARHVLLRQLVHDLEGTSCTATGPGKPAREQARRPGPNIDLDGAAGLVRSQ